jgi:hypothetical protein
LKLVEFVWLAIVAALIGALGGFIGAPKDAETPVSSAAMVTMSAIAAVHTATISAPQGSAEAGLSATHEVRISVADADQEPNDVGCGEGGAEGDGGDQGDNGDDNDDNARSSDIQTRVGECAGILSHFGETSTLAPHQGHGRGTERPPRG